MTVPVGVAPLPLSGETVAESFGLSFWTLVMLMFGIQSFVAFALSPGLPSDVARVSVLPPTERVVSAWTTVVPGVVEFVRVTVQLPVVPTVVHGFVVVNVPGPVLREADRGTGRCGHVAVAVTRVDVDVRREHVRRADRVRGRQRRDLDVRVDVGLDRVDRVAGLAVGLDGDRHAADRERRRSREPVTLPAVGELNVIVHWPAAFVFVPGVGAGAGRSGVRRAVRVGQRDVDVLARRRDEGARCRCPSSA